MKNIHILPTDQPSRLFKFANELHLDTIPKDYYKKYNIYITSDEEIKEGDWYLDTTVNVIFKNDKLFLNGTGYKKITISTDTKLIDDGVQEIDNEFLEWFVKNPSCESVETKLIEQIPNGITFGMFGNDEPPTELIYKIIIPQEEPKQDLEKEWKELEGANLCEPLKSWEDDKQSTLEEAAEKHYLNCVPSDRHSFIAGAKWMEKRMYSKEEVNEIISAIWISCEDNEGETFTEVRKRILEQFKKK